MILEGRFLQFSGDFGEAVANGVDPVDLAEHEDGQLGAIGAGLAEILRAHQQHGQVRAHVVRNQPDFLGHRGHVNGWGSHGGRIYPVLENVIYIVDFD